MKSIEIISAVYNEESGFIEIAKEIVNDDDSIEYAGQSVHPETIEWWAAVYDTEDIDEVIDLILYEPYVENIDPISMPAEEARLKHKEKVDTFKKDKKKKNGNKSASLSRMTDRGIHQKFVEAGSRDPYESIKQHCHIDREVFEAKKAHTEERRLAAKQKETKAVGLREPKDRLAEVTRKPAFNPQVRENKEVKKPSTIKLEKGRRVRE